MCERVVDEHDAVRNETVCTYCDAFANECMGLYSSTRPDTDAALYFDEGTNHHAVGQLAAVDVHRLVNYDLLSKNNIPDAAVTQGWDTHLLVSHRFNCVWQAR